MLPTPSDTKRALRESYRAQRAALSEEARHAQSAAVCARLAQHPACAAPRLVLAYWPLHRTHELDLRPLLHVWAREDRLALPRVTSGPGDAPHMEAVRVQDLAALEAGRFGVMEPTGTAAVAPSCLDTVVLPGFAVDPAGYRLGYGGGFYDAFLAAPGLQATLVFAGYDHALAAHLPREPHDIPAMHTVLPNRAFDMRST